MEFGEYNGAVSTWIGEVLRNRGVNVELTLKYCRDIKEYAEKIDDTKLMGFAYYYSGETYYILNDGKGLFRCITRAITYLDQSGQWDMVARAYNILAITAQSRGNAPIAMDYYLTALGFCRKYRLYAQENMVNLNLGTLYLVNGQWSEAQKYFEKVAYYVQNDKETENYYSLMCCIAISLGRCFLQREQKEKVQRELEYLDAECEGHLEKQEQIAVLCFKAEFYHQSGRLTLLDECILKIHQMVDEDIAVMDLFEDLYGFLELLLGIDREDVFWDIINILEKLTKNANIINLQRRIISLKIKYYRNHNEDKKYLEAAGVYYELAEAMERENQYMVSSMLAVRNSLEQANARRLEVEKANKRLLEKSETDPLTHLSNRFRLNDYSEQAFEQALENATPFAVEILDIDYFKEYNDNYGHQAGDDCLVAIAEELDRMQGDRIFCARYGGDEFIIIYERMTEEEVFAEAEKLREAILARRIAHAYSKALPVVTISQGICWSVPADGNRNWDFLHTADAMLYRVKKRSRNNISMGHLDGNETKCGD